MPKKKGTPEVTETPTQPTNQEPVAEPTADTSAIPEPAIPATAEPAAEASPPTAEEPTTSVPSVAPSSDESAAAPPAKVTLTITGAIDKTIEVAAGTPLEAAFSEATSSKINNYSVRSKGGKSVAFATALNEDMTISVTQKTSAG